MNFGSNKRVVFDKICYDISNNLKNTNNNNISTLLGLEGNLEIAAYKKHNIISENSLIYSYEADCDKFIQQISYKFKHKNIILERGKVTPDNCEINSIINLDFCGWMRTYGELIYQIFKKQKSKFDKFALVYNTSDSQAQRHGETSIAMLDRVFSYNKKMTGISKNAYTESYCGLKSNYILKYAENKSYLVKVFIYYGGSGINNKSGNMFNVLIIKK